MDIYTIYPFLRRQMCFTLKKRIKPSLGQTMISLGTLNLFYDPVRVFWSVEDILMHAQDCTTSVLWSTWLCK